MPTKKERKQVKKILGITQNNEIRFETWNSNDVLVRVYNPLDFRAESNGWFAIGTIREILS